MNTPFAASLSLVLLLLVASPGCGGGGGDAPLVLSEPAIATVDLPPIGALDGFVDNTGYVTSTGLGGILVGDNSDDHVGQGFFTFDSSALPAGAEILKATLEIRQYGISGYPYADLGVIWLDHVELGGTLDAADWGAPALDGNFAVVSTTPATGPLTADVTDQVAADTHAGRTRSSFRLGFTALTDGDGNSDYAAFQDSEDSEGSGLLPRLTVRYR